MNVKNTLLLIFIFIFIDLSRINHLWNENFHRRILHHFQGNLFNPNKTPWINFMDKTIQNNEIKFINSIKNNKQDNIQTLSPLGSKFFGGNYSKKSTLYYNDFTPKVQAKLDKIGNRIKPQLEKLCGKKLELGNSSFRCVLLRYEGENAEFSCHYDTEPHNCYRTLFLIKKQGNVPPFVYFDKNGNKIKKQFNIGEGLFFKGTQTFHCVDKSKDPNMKRYMIGWQYSTDNSIKDISLCSKLRSESKLNIFKIIAPHILITIFIIILFKYLTNSKTTYTQLKILVLVSLITSIIALLNPLKKIKNIGTKIPFNEGILFRILLVCLLSYFDISSGLLFYNYLILSELLLPRKWLVNTKTGLFRN